MSTMKSFELACSMRYERLAAASKYVESTTNTCQHKQYNSIYLALSSFSPLLGLGVKLDVVLISC